MDIDKGVVTLEGLAKIDPQIQNATMLVFLTIAQKGECVARDLEQELGFTNATVSRSITYWTGEPRPPSGKRGPGYIQRHENPRDRRYKLLRLTEAGQAFHRSLMA